LRQRYKIGEQIDKSIRPEYRDVSSPRYYTASFLTDFHVIGLTLASLFNREIGLFSRFLLLFGAFLALTAAVFLPGVGMLVALGEQFPDVRKS
jgi:hypothetical protein